MEQASERLELQPPTHSHQSSPKLHKTEVPSAHLEKQQLRNVQNEISTMQNRIMLLKQQQTREKMQINKNRQRTKEVIDKKLNVNEIQRLKERDNSKDVEKVELLKKRNQQMRSEHEKELNTILKACYLVKLDEARELKSLSAAHERKIKEIKGEIYEEKKAKKERIHNLNEQSKERYRDYWRKRLSELYNSHEVTAQEAAQQRQEKQRYLKKLEEEEIKMLERINKIHVKSVETKKQYITALNIPVKEIGELVAGSENDKNRTDRGERLNSSMDDYHTIKAQTENHSYRQSVHASPHHNSTTNAPLRLPKANLNEAKLRHILNELKRTQHVTGS